MITEPILLSECNDRLVIDNSEKEQYQVNIDPSKYQIIVVGFGANKAGAKFSHPNIMKSVKHIHEFKHYRKGGSKFWTSRAGVDHYLVIPRSEILMLPEKGYSYVPAEINGVKIKFNVGGGTFNGWTDHLGVKAQISVNHKLSDLKKMVAVATEDFPIKESDLGIQELNEHEEREWNRLVAKSNPKIKDAIAKLIEEDKNPVIELNAGLTITSGYGVSVTKKWKGTKQENGVILHNQNGAMRTIIGIFDKMRYSVKISQIDWLKTAEANQIKT